jgi:hypothetical protein
MLSVRGVWEGFTMTAMSAHAEQYRARAEELRTIAQDWIGQETQNALTKAAIDYDRMAHALERVAGQGHPPGSA